MTQLSCLPSCGLVRVAVASRAIQRIRLPHCFTTAACTNHIVARKLNWPTQQAKANTTGEFVCLGGRIETARIGIVKPPAIVGSLLNEVMVSCVKGCNKAVKFSNSEQHIVGNCRGFYEDLDSPSKVTLRDVLSKPSTSPASLAEMKATSHLVRHILSQQEGTSMSSGVVTVLTSSQVRVLK